MDDPIAAADVGFDYPRAIDQNLLLMLPDGDTLPLYGLGAVHLCNHIGFHFSGYDMISQNPGQYILILRFQEILNSSFRKSCKGFVIGSKNCEWPLSLECLHESGGLKRCGKCLECPRRDSGIHDILSFNYGTTLCRTTIPREYIRLNPATRIVGSMR